MACHLADAEERSTKPPRGEGGKPPRGEGGKPPKGEGGKPPKEEGGKPPKPKGGKKREETNKNKKDEFKKGKKESQRDKEGEDGSVLRSDKKGGAVTIHRKGMSASIYIKDIVVRDENENEVTYSLTTILR